MEVKGKGYVARIHGTPNQEKIKAATTRYCKNWIFKEEKKHGTKHSSN